MKQLLFALIITLAASCTAQKECTTTTGVLQYNIPNKDHKIGEWKTHAYKVTVIDSLGNPIVLIITKSGFTEDSLRAQKNKEDW